MENKLEDFLAGVEATFGYLARNKEELSGFLHAAEQFYLGFIGVLRPSTSEDSVPFWRYLIFYATLALDHAATADNAEAPSEEEAMYKDIASELSSCWPLLSILITQQYGAPTPQPQLELQVSPQSIKHGSPQEGTSAGTRISALRVDTAVQTDITHTSASRPRLPRHPSVMRTVEAVTPPIYDADHEILSVRYSDIMSQPTRRQEPAMWDSYLDRASSTGRSLSESTQLTNSSSSSYPSDILYTPTQVPAESPFQIKHEQSYPASTPMGRSFSSSSGPLKHIPEYAQIRSDSTTPTINSYRQPFNQSERTRAAGAAKAVSGPGASNVKQAIPISQNKYYSPQTAQIKLLLADRGDNTAKLVPMSDGSYILDISIGGKKLLVHPERPTEIQYHNAQGAVVTQSLISPAIHAQ